MNGRPARINARAASFVHTVPSGDGGCPSESERRALQRDLYAVKLGELQHQSHARSVCSLGFRILSTGMHRHADPEPANLRILSASAKELFLKPETQPPFFLKSSGFFLVLAWLSAPRLRLCLGQPNGMEAQWHPSRHRVFNHGRRREGLGLKTEPHAPKTDDRKTQLKNAHLDRHLVSGSTHDCKHCLCT